MQKSTDRLHPDTVETPLPTVHADLPKSPRWGVPPPVVVLRPPSPAEEVAAILVEVFVESRLFAGLLETPRPCDALSLYSFESRFGLPESARGREPRHRRVCVGTWSVSGHNPSHSGTVYESRESFPCSQAHTRVLQGLRSLGLCGGSVTSDRVSYDTGSTPQVVCGE